MVKTRLSLFTLSEPEISPIVVSEQDQNRGSTNIEAKKCKNFGRAVFLQWRHASAVVIGDCCKTGPNIVDSRLFIYTANSWR